MGTVGLGSSTRWDLISTTRNQENGVANFRAYGGRPRFVENQGEPKDRLLPCNLHRADAFEPGALDCNILKDARRTVSPVLLKDSEDDDSG